MAVGLLIYQFIQFEKSFDIFHPDSDEIYRIVYHSKRGEVDLESGIFGNYGLRDAIQQQVSEVKEVIRVHPQQDGFVFANREKELVFQEDNIWFVDEKFFTVFGFELIGGSAETVLEKKQSVVMTESTAKKYFGRDSALGRQISVNAGWATNTYEVTGIVADPPSNSHMQFDIVFPMKLVLENNRIYNSVDHGWKLDNFVTYIKVAPGSASKIVTEKIDQILVDRKTELLESGINIETSLQNLIDVHLTSDFTRDISTNHGASQNIALFAVIVFFVLLIAWINYINLSTAFSLKRTKELGIRKVLGAHKFQLVGQFVIEAAIYHIISSFIALTLALLLRKYLNGVIGIELEISILYTWEFWVWYVIIMMIGSTVSGLYPSLLVSSFKPVSISQSLKSSGNRSKSQKFLVVFQFTVSLLLASGALLVYRQITYMQNKELGIDAEKILVINGPRAVLELARQGKLEELKNRHQSFKNEVSGYYNVAEISGTSSVPLKGAFWSGNIRKSGGLDNTPFEANIILVDENFLRTYELELVAGSNVRDDMFWLDDGVLINEKAVEALGLISPKEAVSQKIILSVGDTLRVLGVLKDFHWNSIKESQAPFVFGPDYYNAYFTVRLNAEVTSETVKYIRNAYAKFFPRDSFSYYFLDTEFDRQYRSDLQFRNLFFGFTLFAVLVASLGLFALVSFATHLRLKEITIRKVLGATTHSIMVLLSREYILLLIIANLLSAPLVFYFGSDWLENYPYHTSINWTVFLIPGVVLLVVSVFTVGYRIFQAAKASPVSTLRTD